MGRIPSVGRACAHRVLSTPATGPIDSVPSTSAQRGTIWLESIFPIKLTRWDPRHFLVKRYANDLRKEAKASILPSPTAFPEGRQFTYLSSVAAVKEGGVLLNFEYNGGSLAEAFETIQKHIQEKGLRSSFNFAKIVAYPVKGSPFVEDLQSSVPSVRLKVDFIGPELTVEELFKEFRAYGKIEDINIVGKTAHVQYSRIRSSTAARNCLHDACIQSTRLSIAYEKSLTRNAIFNFVRDHPRLSIPILLALVAAISFVIFDPLRVFFVTNEITQRFSLNKFKSVGTDWINAVVRFVKTRLYGAELKKSDDDHGLIDRMFSETETVEKNLFTLLKEPPETLILISGPEGAGKSQMVDKVLAKSKYTLKIDCSALVDSRDHVMLERLAKQVGYFPMFSWYVNVGAYVDTLITATTGAKAGIASTSDAQIRQMLEIITISLNRITSKQRSARAEAIALQKEAASDGTSSDSVVVAAVPEVDYPVVVIEEFLSKERSKQQMLYDILTEWAGTLADYKIAHVVFISNSPSAQKVISRSVPKKTVETLFLHDASLESSLAYVRQRLGLVFSPKELDKCVDALGGRLMDLESFISKVQAGSKNARRALPDVIERSFNDLVARTVTEIRKVGLGEDSAVQNASEWNSIQFWKVASLLSRFEEIEYDDLKMHPLFNGKDEAISAMERSGLITISLKNGRPATVKPAKPIFKTAFSQLLSDQKLCAVMGIQTSKALIKDEEAKIQKIEEEVQSLSGALNLASRDHLERSARRDLEARLNFLSRQIGESQQKIAGYTAEESRLKKLVKLTE